MSPKGKKIGELHVRLDRVKKKVRWGAYSDDKASFTVDLRFDIHDGTFYAKHDGVVYSAKTQAELHDKIKAAVERTIDVVWERYLIVNYSASARMMTLGRHPHTNSSTTLEIDSERDELEVRDVSTHEEREGTITGIELLWEIEEYTQPWARPEDGKTVRSRRSVIHRIDLATDVITEHLGDPSELDNAELPAGAVLWTAEREAFLHSVLAALGQLDAKMVELFRGPPDDVAKRLDRGAFSLMLAAASGASAACSDGRNGIELAQKTRKRRRAPGVG